MKKNKLSDEKIRGLIQKIVGEIEESTGYRLREKIAKRKEK